jgi:uncharacterized protein involved in exopolysaccharide biosynthesis
MSTAHPDDHALADALMLLWARRLHILLAVAGAALIAFVVSSSLPKTYRATATFVIADAKFPTGGQDAPTDLRYVETYASLLRNPSVSAAVVKELDLGRRLGFTPSRLSSSLGVRSVPSTLLITLYMELGDPALAAEIVNAQAARATALSRTMLTSDLTDTRAYLQEQVAAAQTDLKAKEAELERVKREVRVESDTERLKRIIEVRGVIEEQYAKAAQDAAGAEQAVKAIRGALAGQSRLLTLNRQVVDDPALKEAASAERPRTPSELLGLRMQEQVVNPLYERSEPELVKAQAEAAGAAARRDAAAAQLKANLAEVRAIERDLAAGSVRLEAAKREYDLAKGTYEAFSKSYETSRLTVRAQVPELKLVHGAEPDPNPVGPRVLLNVTIAVVAGFILAVFAFLLGDYLRAARRPAPAPVTPGEPDDVELARTRTLHAPGAR